MGLGCMHVPRHCFECSVFCSFSYVFYDLILSAIFYNIANTYFHLLPTPLSYMPVYWALRGCILAGVWVIARECCHHACSDYQWLDDIVGLILHSALLVPYFSWKYSHHRHHSNTGSLDRDEVFGPKPKSKISWYSKYLNNPLGRASTLAATILLGWPLYLACNVSGRPYDRLPITLIPMARYILIGRDFRFTFLTPKFLLLPVCSIALPQRKGWPGLYASIGAITHRRWFPGHDQILAAHSPGIATPRFL